MSITATQVTREVTTSTTFERFARAGYLARGALYVLMGVLAIELARGQASETPNQEGAMRLVADGAFGRVLLVLIAIGLAGYAALRFTQAFRGRTPEAGEHSAMDRIAAFGSGCAYTVFLALAIAILAGAGSGSKPSSTTSDVFGWPAGRALVFAAGAVFLIVAGYQAYMGISRKFLSQTKTQYMSRTSLQRFTVLGVVGHLARAVVFGLIAVFLIKAAAEYDPSEAVGIDGALRRLQDHAYGTVALVAVAIGLIAFGVYSIVDARHRAI